MTDYGDEQRRARLYNERLLINWHAGPPRYRIRWRIVAASVLIWIALALILCNRGL